MNSTWGVYPVRAKLQDGTHVEANDRRAVRWFVRWRVYGGERKRTFRQKGHAAAFHKELTKAQVMGWDADDRGWPLDPTAGAGTPTTGEVAVDDAGTFTFAKYCEDVWWPTMREVFDGDKNRIGHRANMRLAVQLLRYRAGDPRVGRKTGARVGESIRFDDLRADDLRLMMVERRGINGRTAAVNARRIATAVASGEGDVEVELEPEEASAATVRAFYITVGMIVRAATKSDLTTGDPMDGVAKVAPKAKPARMSQRLVPTLDEVFDLAEAIAGLGPRMSDGRPAGERFRSLILCAGTLGPRPGELVAHRPEWIDWDGEPPAVRFHETEAAVYDAEEGLRGRRTQRLKHREEGEFRTVPLLPEVADALRVHVERGYSGLDRTWMSATGRAHLDWGNLEDVYWRPACEAVFAGSAKPGLAMATPGVLRKASITFWLESGISPLWASELSGHSEEVLRAYYASRASALVGTRVDNADELRSRDEVRWLGISQTNV